MENNYAGQSDQKLNEQETSKLQNKMLIEMQLSKLIEASLEGEYEVDKLGNIVYKTGGKKRATDKIQQLLVEWEEKCNISRSEIKKMLQDQFTLEVPEGNFLPMENTEIINILEELDKKEQENIEEEKTGNDEKSR